MNPQPLIYPATPLNVPESVTRPSAVEDALRMVGQLKDAEDHFKITLSDWLNCGAFDHMPDAKLKTQKYLDSSYAYFSGDSFFENELMTSMAL